jgi:hypothetical protein
MIACRDQCDQTTETNARSAVALASVLEFARGQIERLDEYSDHWETGETGAIRLVDKIATEGALLLLLARRVASRWADVDGHCEALAAALVPRIRNSRLRGLLVRSPQTAATLGAGHVFLTAAGFPDATFDELVRGGLDDGFAETVERVPYRLLDQRWTRNLTASEPRGFDDLLNFSILRSRAHPFYMTQTDAYAITHAIMYSTDFGRHRLPAALDLQRVRDMVQEGLAWHIVSEDFDLLVEYLICAECVGTRASPYARFADRLVQRSWADLQFLPGPTFDPERYRAMVGKAAAAYAVEHMYHTNFVWGMYCAVRLGSFAECETDPASDQSVDNIERLLAHALSIDGTKASVRSPWFLAVADTPAPSKALEGVLWDAITIEAARRDDWAQAGALVSLAVDARLPPSSTLRELDYMQARIRRHFPQR